MPRCAAASAGLRTRATCRPAPTRTPWPSSSPRSWTASPSRPAAGQAARSSGAPPPSPCTRGRRPVKPPIPVIVDRDLRKRWVSLHDPAEPTHTVRPGWSGRGSRPGCTGELAEVADEVRLVGIAAIGGDAVPAGRLAVAQVMPDVLEAQQPGRGLGGEADLLPELPDQVLVAPADLARQRSDRHRARGADQPPPGPTHFGGGGGSAADAVQQEVIERGEPLAPGPQLADRVPQPPSVAAGQLTEVDEGSAKLIHGRAEQRVRAQR